MSNWDWVLKHAFLTKSACHRCSLKMCIPLPSVINNQVLTESWPTYYQYWYIQIQTRNLRHRMPICTLTKQCKKYRNHSWDYSATSPFITFWFLTCQVSHFCSSYLSADNILLQQEKCVIYLQQNALWFISISNTWTYNMCSFGQKNMAFSGIFSCI